MENSEVTENPSASKEMSFTAEEVNAEISALVRDTVSVSPGATVKARLREAARRLRLSYRRAAQYRYGEVRRIDAHEADKIRHLAKLAKHERLVRLQREYTALRTELVAETAQGLGWLLPPAVGEIPSQGMINEGEDGDGNRGN